MNHEFSDGAIDALIAASLRQAYSDDPPTDASIDAAIKAASVEDPGDAERLQRIRSRLSAGAAQPKPAVRRQQISGHLMAMNRKNEENDFSEATQDALDDARRKALDELLNDKESKEGGEGDDQS